MRTLYRSAAIRDAKRLQAAIRECSGKAVSRSTETLIDRADRYAGAVLAMREGPKRLADRGEDLFFALVDSCSEYIIGSDGRAFYTNPDQWICAKLSDAITKVLADLSWMAERS